jgi:hypothetical protein
MNHYEKTQKLNDVDFKQIIGVTRETFAAMTEELPGKKALLEDSEIEVILVDVTECPIERSEKSSENGTPGKRSGTP